MLLPVKWIEMDWMLVASCLLQNSFKNILDEQLLIEGLPVWDKLVSLLLFDFIFFAI